MQGWFSVLKFKWEKLRLWLKLESTTSPAQLLQKACKNVEKKTHPKGAPCTRKLQQSSGNPTAWQVQYGASYRTREGKAYTEYKLLITEKCMQQLPLC